MKKLVLTLVLIPCYLFILECKAQNQQKIDSLNRALPASTGKDRQNILNSLCLEYADNHNEIALQYIGQSIAFAKASGDSLQIVLTQRIQGQLYARLDSADKAISAMRAALPIALRNNYVSEQKKIFNSLGIYYTLTGEFAQALQFDFQSLLLREESGTQFEINSSYMNIGFTHFKLGNYKQALAFFKKSLAIKNAINDHQDLTNLLIDMALCYNNTNESAKAFHTIAKAQLACGATGGAAARMTVTNALGTSYLKIGRLRNAELYFIESYKLAESTGNKRFQIDNITQLVRIHLLRNNIPDASKLLTLAEDLARKSAYEVMLLTIYRNWSQLYSQAGDFKNAALYDGKFIGLNERLFTDKIAEMADVQSDFNQSENRKIIQSQKVILDLRSKIIRNERLVTLLIALLALFLVVSLLYLYMKYKEKKKHNELLEQKVRERTKVLDENITSLTRKIDSQIRLHRQTNDHLREQLSTIKGLASIVLNEKADTETVKKAGTLIADTETKMTSIINGVSR